MNTAPRTCPLTPLTPRSVIADPSNCGNRVWLRKGQVHLIPLDEPGRGPDGGIAVAAALRAMATTPASTVANRRVQVRGVLCPFFGNVGRSCVTCVPTARGSVRQRTIAARTSDVYPAKAAASVHRTLCVVAADVAAVLQSDPHRVSDALNGFYLATSADAAVAATGKTLRAYTAAMQRFPPSPVALVAVPVRMTRLQYAKMTFQKAHPPKKFHRAMEVVAAAGNTALSRAFDMGCRLTVGLEVAYQRGKAGAAAQAHPTEVHLCRAVDRIAPPSPGPPAHGVLDEAGFDAAVAALRAAFAHAARTHPADADAWLYMRPDELDAEMQARMHAAAGGSSGGGGGGPAFPGATPSRGGADGSTAAAKPPAPPSAGATAGDGNSAAEGSGAEAVEELQKLVSGLRRFMAAKSGPEGVESEKPAAPVCRDASSSSSSSSSSRGGAAATGEAPNTAASAGAVGDVGGLVIDFDRVMQLVSGAAPVAPSTAPAPPAAAAASGASAQGGAPLSDYFYDDDLRQLDDDGDSDDNDDSDDEGDNTGGGGGGSGGDGAAPQPATGGSPVSPSYQGVRSFRFPAPRANDAADTAGPTAVDSDDEEEDEDGDEDGEGKHEGEGEGEAGAGAAYFAEYQRQMDRELAGSTLFESFEREARPPKATDGDEDEDDEEDDDVAPVDEDLNLLKYLLESRASQLGAAGPATQLLSQLGITLPAMPPMHEDERRK